MLSLSSLTQRLYSAAHAEELSPLNGVASVIVTVDSTDAVTTQLDYLPSCPIIAVYDGKDRMPFADVIVQSPDAASEVAEAISGNPIASSVLAQLLRHNERVDVADRLFAESLAYSTLQHGAEFRAWLQSRTPKQIPPDERPAVSIERVEDELTITLDRPERRNAYSSSMRDGLCEALQLLADDPSISKAVLRGAGVCFSAGGDLDEFGVATDAAIAHASRVARSAGALLHALRERIEVRVHGACIGAGIELPAFAGHITTTAETFFQLPEVSMGLIPGAGGTASILPRIGRQRLAYMALTGARIDAETALSWGLVDRLSD